MSLPWVELHTNLPDHPKSLALADELGDERAWGYFAHLLIYCGRSQPSGEFPTKTACAVIERAVGWRGERGRLYAAMSDCGFLDGDPERDVIRVHGWEERAAAHVAKLERDAERQRERRTKVAARFSSKRHADVQATSSGRPSDVTRTSSGCHADVAGNKNRNTNPNPNPLLSEEKDLSPSPPEEEPFELSGEAASTPRKRSEGQKFFDWTQSARTKETGLVAEVEPKPAALNVFFQELVKTCGSLLRAQKTYAHFLRPPEHDPHWKDRGFPFAGFMSSFRKYVPPEERAA